MNRRDGHHIVFNINNVYITINHQGGTDLRNNNDGREETNQNPTPTATDVNQRNNSENDQIRKTSEVSESTDPVSSQVVINQPSTSRTNENSDPETEDRPGSLGNPEMAKQVSDNDEITKSALEQNSQTESKNRSKLQSVTEKSANDIDAKPVETENKNNEPCAATAVSGRTESKDTILMKTETTSTELVNTSTESKLSEKVEDRAATGESSAKPPEETKHDDDNKENNGRKKAFNPNLSFNFSSDLFKIKEKEATDLVLSEKPSFQFTSLRRSAPEPFFKFQAKSEEVPSIEASRSKLINRQIFIRSQSNSLAFCSAKKSMTGDNAEMKKTNGKRT